MTYLCCAAWAAEHPDDNICPQHRQQGLADKTEARAWDKGRRVMRGDFVAYAVS